MLASVIIDRVRRTLLDPAPGVTWSDADLLDYLSAAQRAVCVVKSDAFTKRANVSLVSGVAQTLPSDGLSLIDVIINSDGTPINQVGRSLLQNTKNAWAAATAQSKVLEYIGDTRDPRRFLVYPPNDGTGVVLVTYGAIPPPLTSTSDDIALIDIYDNPLWAWTCGLAYAENTKRQDLQKSQQMFGVFNAMVGAKTQTQIQMSPKLDNKEQM